MAAGVYCPICTKYHISAGVGQGYNAFTPVQQAVAIATIASDCVALWPHLARAIENVKTGTTHEIAPRTLHTVAIKPEHLAPIKNALVGVAREGASARAFVGAPYVSAAKTGTVRSRSTARSTRPAIPTSDCAITRGTLLMRPQITHASPGGIGRERPLRWAGRTDSSRLCYVPGRSSLGVPVNDCSSKRDSRQ